MAYAPSREAPQDERKKVYAAVRNHELTKATQTLIGICSGIVADDHLNDREVQFLSTWMAEHPGVAEQWPGSEVVRRIREIMADGIITAEERTDLLDALQKISGNFFSETGAAAEEGPALPIDDDPSIFFKDMTFCFTGQFIFGTRANCERAVLKLGGMPIDNITKRLNYLVIGTMIEPHWINTTYGRKIEKAVSYRDEGCDLVIVSERQWTAALADIG
jgi:NAD-dependent DNA ligase